jgi:hypothetical protein
MGDAKRKTIHGAGWKKTSTIAQDKYEIISAAILKVLTPEPVRFSEVVQGVAECVPDFSGSVDWYTITCLRELESQGKVIRHKTKPVGYSKKNSSRERSK